MGALTCENEGGTEQGPFSPPPLAGFRSLSTTAGQTS